MNYELQILHFMISLGGEWWFFHLIFHPCFSAFLDLNIMYMSKSGLGLLCHHINYSFCYTYYCIIHIIGTFLKFHFLFPTVGYNWLFQTLPIWPSRSTIKAKRSWSGENQTCSYHWLTSLGNLLIKTKIYSISAAF